MSQAANSTQYSSNNDVALESVDRFDLALAAWFAQHPGAWYGTVTELIAALKNGADAGTDLWPQGRAFLSHLESHRRTLRSLGVDVSPHAGFPRMVSLRSCQGEMLRKEQPSGTSAIDCASDTLKNSDAADTGQQNPGDMFSSGVGPAESVPDTGKHANENDSVRPIFENIAEALFCVVKMQDQIAEQSTDLKCTVDLVASRTQELIRCSGVAVGLLQQNALVYAVRLGIASTMTALPFRTNHFDSCIRQGTVLALPDAQQDPVLGMICRRKGVKSLIALPIFHKHEVAGTMELLFKEMHCFSTGDIMTLELIADIVGGRVTCATEPAQSEGQKSHSYLRITEDVEPQSDPVVVAQARLSFSQYSSSDTTQGAFGNLGSSIPDTITELAAAPVARKRVWTSLP